VAIVVTDSVCKVMLRELASLRAEIESYDKEEDLWALPPGISNAAGTLTLHLCGNLQHYVGAQLGSTGYVRDRDAEFGRRNVPREELLAQIDAASMAVETTLPRITPERLAADFPEAVLGHTLNTGDFLVHLASHLGYHLGQVDYHRRIVTGEDRPMPRVSVERLRSAKP
jgi:hypothetical protein